MVVQCTKKAEMSDLGQGFPELKARSNYSHRLHPRAITLLLVNAVCSW